MTLLIIFLVALAITGIALDKLLSDHYYNKFKKLGFDNFIIEEEYANEKIKKINFSLCTNIYEAEALYKVINEENEL